MSDYELFEIMEQDFTPHPVVDAVRQSNSVSFSACLLFRGQKYLIESNFELREDALLTATQFSDKLRDYLQECAAPILAKLNLAKSPNAQLETN